MKYETDNMKDSSNFGVVSEIVEIWKQIPIATNYFVNNKGVVVGNFTNKQFVVKQFEYKTTKGTYLYVTIRKNEGNVEIKPVHQLVCLAFHGYPPDNGNRYEPNHKDGNKHNNTPDNLEWVTRSENILHAFQSGLCTAGIRIKATNAISKEIKQFNSLSEAARFFGETRHNFRDKLVRFKNTPWNGIWFFETDSTSDKKLQRYQVRSIIYKDYVTGLITIAADSVTASYQTNVQSGSIVNRTDLNRKHNSRYKLLSRYVFKDLKDETEWPDYTVEEALESERNYKMKRDRGFQIPCLIKFYKTDEIRQYSNIDEAARNIVTPRPVSSISTELRWLIHNNILDIKEGVVIKSLSDDRPWPIYTDEEINKSFIQPRMTVNRVTNI
jgi:hypothetical protein